MRTGAERSGQRERCWPKSDRWAGVAKKGGAERQAPEESKRAHLRPTLPISASCTLAAARRALWQKTGSSAPATLLARAQISGGGGGGPCAFGAPSPLPSRPGTGTSSPLLVRSLPLFSCVHRLLLLHALAGAERCSIGHLQGRGHRTAAVQHGTRRQPPIGDDGPPPLMPGAPCCGCCGAQTWRSAALSERCWCA
jgi:hypothetical protein